MIGNSWVGENHRADEGSEPTKHSKSRMANAMRMEVSWVATWNRKDIPQDNKRNDIGIDQREDRYRRDLTLDYPTSFTNIKFFHFLLPKRNIQAKKKTHPMDHRYFRITGMRYKELHMDRTKIPCQKTPYRDVLRSWKEEETIYQQVTRHGRLLRSNGTRRNAEWGKEDLPGVAIEQRKESRKRNLIYRSHPLQPTVRVNLDPFGRIVYRAVWKETKGPDIKTVMLKKQQQNPSNGPPVITDHGVTTRIKDEEKQRGVGQPRLLAQAPTAIQFSCDELQIKHGYPKDHSSN